MEPLNDYVIVRKSAFEEETTPGGIVLPGTTNQHFTKAYVVAIGPGRPLANGGHEPLGLYEEDIVLVPLAAMIDYEYLGRRLSIVQGSSIVAVLSRYKKEGDAH